MLPYTDSRGRRGRGGHSHIQTLGGRGGGEGIHIDRPYGEEGEGGHSHIQTLGGGGGGESIHIYRP